MKHNRLSLVCLLGFPALTLQQQNSRSEETFKTELFLNKNELNSGLYEGEVRGRRRFGETQVPHGYGAIYYFSNDKYNRVNYTGEWVNGERQGNGTTNFRDGAVYRGEYRSGLEHGQGYISYPNGNSLDAEFVAGKIMGHGVFRYSTGDQREGFFRDNILDGQVIYTRGDGTTAIETWSKGEKVESAEEEAASNEIPAPVTSSTLAQEQEPRLLARGGRPAPAWGQGAEKDAPRLAALRAVVQEPSQVVRSRARSFLFDIYSNVN